MRVSKLITVLKWLKDADTVTNCETSRVTANKETSLSAVKALCSGNEVRKVLKKRNAITGPMGFQIIVISCCYKKPSPLLTLPEETKHKQSSRYFYSTERMSSESLTAHCR